MRAKYIEKEYLPPLAWTAYVCGNEISVLHGSAVDCRENCFVEGAWSGDFGKMGFLSADWFCGTGAFIYKNRIVFSTPTHVTYGIYATKIGGVLRKQ